QYFFVNGRLVKDRVLTHAASRACEQFDFDGHPAIVLFVDVPPELVDVNVHPAKTEVRFRESSQVHVAVEQALRRALGGAEEGSGLLETSVAPAILPAMTYQATLAGATQTRSGGVDFSPLFQQRP